MNKLIPLVLLSFSLTACVLPAPRSYTSSVPNVSILKEDSLNIDQIKPVKFTVMSNKAWQNTGTFLGNGDRVTVSASGSWSPLPALLAWSGPEGNILWSVQVKGITGGALMAKLGTDGKPFEIGLNRSFEAKGYGMLYLAMNEPFRYVYDNQGKVDSEIYVQGSGSAASAGDGGRLEIVSYSYNDKSKRGEIAARIGDQAFATRQLLIKKIGEIASSKNIAIKAGDEPLKDGVYTLLNESSKNGVLVINFETLY